ncbi:MAG: glycoside hydrolase family 38 C-terminal domain-containing protein [Spirochaetota bacterium]
MREVHLICNAHLDPVWLWQWEEGAAEALSTFRIAADFCEAYDGYIFNHNEAVLYEWIEEYDGALFARIQRLVAAGRWHIMGGWYLQPDCNLPSGESFVRHILYGRRYFAEKFGARPTTAINFDPFGHSRGLVQILAKSGYDSYIFGRPFADDLELPAEEFTWVGFDGSTVVAHRPFGHYLTHRGEAVDKVVRFLESEPDPATGLILWGIGNHGGGASKEDLDAIAGLIREADTVRVLHSTPESYFAARRSEAGEDRPRFSDHLNPWAPGCYTSQIRIKQRHRALEDLLLSTEKMAAGAALNGRLAYPRDELREALRDLMFCQFHDILPGSSIPAAEEAALVRLGHGIDTVARVRARALFALTAGEPEPADGEIPLFVYNPHPFPVAGVFEVEFQPASQNREGTFTTYRVRQSGAQPVDDVPVQFEKEASTVGVDWRKRMVFRASLPPAALSRFDCAPVALPSRPLPVTRPDSAGTITVDNGEYRASISTRTGLLESYMVGGEESLDGGAPRPIVVNDSDDAWESQGRSFRDLAGTFRLASPSDTARICGVRAAELEAVRVIEDGPVRTVVEAVFVYGGSQLVLTYGLPRVGVEVEIGVRVIWSEKHAMLKIGIPLSSTLRDRFVGQTAFGVQDLARTGEEAVARAWVAALGAKRALTVINDGTYGSSMEGGELRLTLLRSPAYAALPVGTQGPAIPQDRFSPRMDQGERVFRFWLSAGAADDRLAEVDREATARGEAPFLLMVFPSPDANAGRPGSPARASAITLSDDTVQLAALKAAEDGDGWIVRLFEPTGTARTTKVSIPSLSVREEVRLGPFEASTYRAGGSAGSRLAAVNLVEEPDASG